MGNGGAVVEEERGGRVRVVEPHGGGLRTGGPLRRFHADKGERVDGSSVVQVDGHAGVGRGTTEQPQTTGRGSGQGSAEGVRNERAVGELRHHVRRRRGNARKDGRCSVLEDFDVGRCCIRLRVKRGF